MFEGVLIFAVLYIGFKYWGRLREFIRIWRTPIQFPEARLAVTEELPPSSELAHLFLGAAVELKKEGYGFRHSLATDDRVEFLQVFDSTTDLATFAMVSAPTNPVIREYDLTLVTNLESESGEKRPLLTKAGPVDSGLATSDHVVYSTATTLVALQEEHRGRLLAEEEKGLRRLPGRRTAEDDVAALARSAEETLRRNKENGGLVERGGQLFPSASVALKAVGYAQAARPRVTGEATRTECIESTTVKSLAARCVLKVRQEERSTNPGYPFIFAVSLLVSIGVFSLWLGWDVALMVLVIIFLHEAGHWLGMKLCGYRDAKIFFVPMFGGVAMGKKRTTTVVQELVVLLLGPMPGIILGLALLTAVDRLGWVPLWFLNYAVFSVILNFLNLLPLMPLDGGRIVHALFLRRFPTVGFIFSVLSVCGMAVVAYFLESWILGVLAVFGFLRLFAGWYTAGLQKAARANWDAHGGDRLWDTTERVVEAMEDNPPPAALRPLANRVTAINQIATALRSPSPSTPTVIVGTIVYLAALGLPLFIWLIYLPFLSLN